MENAMIIHVVQKGNVNSIAEHYGLSAERLALRMVSMSHNITIGETIIILFPEIVYTVKMVILVASGHNISIMELQKQSLSG